MQSAVDKYKTGETQGDRRPPCGQAGLPVQAVEYREQGRRVAQNWIDTSLTALKTSSEKALVNTAQRGQ
ncbi:hypothetical protein ACIRD6_36185 [Streptomyces sp. NPDC102473]|uniref:hypothetical protein n=1 Tax=Streptomyces sp. NPDC102473 TaxID=3366180 RepID=UPI0038084C8C